MKNLRRETWESLILDHRLGIESLAAAQNYPFDNHRLSQTGDRLSIVGRRFSGETAVSGRVAWKETIRQAVALLPMTEGIRPTHNATTVGRELKRGQRS